MRMTRNATAKKILFFLSILMPSATLLVLPYSVSDPINLPKMVALVVFSGVIAGVLVSSLSEFRLGKYRPILILASLFASNLVILMIVFREFLGEIFYGVPGRNTGVLTYLAFLVVMLASSYVANDYSISRVFYLLFGCGVILIFYGFIQAWGREPFPYINVYESNVFGTFGNPNFQSAFLGMVSVLLVPYILISKLRIIYRLAAGLFLLAALYGIELTNSIQGYFNFIIGTAVMIFLFFVINKWKILSALTLVVTVFGIASIIAAFFKMGPLAEFIYKGSMAARVYYWDTAFRIAADNPFFGVGPDKYGDWIRHYRTVAEVQTNLTADSSHSVYFDVLSGGGFPLFFVYMGITWLTAISIFRTIRRQIRVNTLYIGLVGLWVAHQAQSLISIGHIGIAVWGWVFSGLIIGYEIHGRDELKMSDDKPTKKVKSVNTESQAAKIVVAGTVGLAAGLLVALPPFVAAQRHYNSFKSGNGEAITSATVSKPHNRNNFFYTISVFQTNKFTKEALKLAEQATDSFPNSFIAWKTLYDLAPEGSKSRDQAFERLNFLDPNNPLYQK
jgi:O-antigen ligase